MDGNLTLIKLNNISDKNGEIRMSNEQEQVTIYIQENLNVSQRSFLVTKLEHENGIVSAWFEDGETHHLTVLYESEHFSQITLLDTIEQHGFQGKILDRSAR